MTQCLSFTLWIGLRPERFFNTFTLSSPPFFQFHINNCICNIRICVCVRPCVPVRVCIVFNRFGRKIEKNNSWKISESAAPWVSPRRRSLSIDRRKNTSCVWSQGLNACFYSTSRPPIDSWWSYFSRISISNMPSPPANPQGPANLFVRRRVESFSILIFYILCRSAVYLLTCLFVTNNFV